MKKLKEFIYMFCWILSCQIITADIGFTTERNAWGKYVVAIVAGLTWSFYFQPMIENRKQEEKGNPE